MSDQTPSRNQLLTVPPFPTMPDGTRLAAMRVSTDPERFVYGDQDTLDWLRGQIEGQAAVRPGPV